MTLYDQVAYPNHAIPQSHPDRLVVIGAMLGLHPTPVEKARVLDIGCGAGGNLLPLAALYPASEFVGIDLASTAIEQAVNAASSLKLTNVRFECVDIQDLPESLGKFDYILAHGFISWVPDVVRRKIFSIVRDRLAPQGIAYISYNAYPGCHIREMFREVMLYHVRHIEDPQQRAVEARKIVEMMASASDDDKDPMHQLVAAEYELIARKTSGGLTHDDLNPIFQPLYFRDFASLAEEHGLQFLHEASYNDGQPPPEMSEEAAALLAQTNGFAEREQYMDFLKLRRFRQSLIVHQEVTIDRSQPHQAMNQFHYAANLERRAVDGGAVEFTNRVTKAAVGTSDPLTIYAMDAIGRAWPATVPFDQLADPAFAEPLKRSLERYFAAGIVEVLGSPRLAITKLSERPEIWEYARFQAATGAFLTSLTMNDIRIDDPNIKRLVLAADGTRTVDELGALFGDRASVEQALLSAAQFGFLFR